MTDHVLTPELVETFCDNVDKILGDDGKNWFKGGPIDPEDHRRVCIMQAHSLAKHILIGDHLYNMFNLTLIAQDVGSKVVCENYRDRIDSLRVMDTDDDDGHPLAQFNDHPDTTFAEVHAVSEKIRAGLLEKLAAL